MLQLIFLNFLFASTFTLAKDAVLHTPPLLFLGIRMILAGSLFLSFLRFYKKEPCTIAHEHRIWFIAIAFFHIYISFCAEFIGMQYLTSGKVSLLFNLSPFITAIFAYLFFKESLSIKKTIGLIIGFCGFLPLLEEAAPLAESIGFSLLGISGAELMILTAVISSCIGWIIMKKLTSHYKYSYIFVNGVAMLFGGILMLISSQLTEKWPPLLTLFSTWGFWRPMILLILIANIICYNLYAKLLQKYSPTILSFFSSMIPLFGAFLGWLIFNEQISKNFFITFCLVSFGLYLYYQEELRQGSIKH